MKSKTIGLAVVALGLALAVIALVVRFVIFPGQAQWPNDVDSIRDYDGTLHVMLNPQALSAMDLANVFLRDVPTTLSRHVTTEGTQGDKAVVLEVATMFGPGGQEMLASETWYAIDRKTMMAVSPASVSELQNAENVSDREGLVIGFPIGTAAETYRGWSSDYQTTMDVNYVTEEERSGLNTFVFESSSPPKETLDPEMLAIFPPALPKDLLVTLAQTLDLPAAMSERFATILPDLADPVPLKYTYEYETTYWVEPSTGVLIDYSKHESYQAALSIEGIPVPVPITPVFEQSYKMSPSSIQEAAKDANDAKSQLQTFGTAVPLALGAIGVLLVIFGAFLAQR